MEILDLTDRGVRLERATKRHARTLARIMRDKDREECKMAGNFAPEAAIRMSLNNSIEAYAAYVKDDLLAIFGVGPLNGLPEVKVVWALTSVHVDKHALTFGLGSKTVLNYLRGKYPLMVNMIYSKSTRTIGWLQRLGFIVSPPEHFGPHGALFCKAIMHTPKIEVIHV